MFGQLLQYPKVLYILHLANPIIFIVFVQISLLGLSDHLKEFVSLRYAILYAFLYFRLG